MIRIKIDTHTNSDRYRCAVWPYLPSGSISAESTIFHFHVEKSRTLKLLYITLPIPPYKYNFCSNKTNKRLQKLK